MRRSGPFQQTARDRTTCSVWVRRPGGRRKPTCGGLQAGRRSDVSTCPVDVSPRLAEVSASGAAKSAVGDETSWGWCRSGAETRLPAPSLYSHGGRPMLQASCAAGPSCHGLFRHRPFLPRALRVPNSFYYRRPGCLPRRATGYSGRVEEGRRPLRLGPAGTLSPARHSRHAGFRARRSSGKPVPKTWAPIR